MRFDGYDPNYAILRAGDGRPFKVEADVATTLPDRIYAFNEQLFTLLCTAFENDDLSVLDSLWSTAAHYVRPHESGGTPIIPRRPGNPR